MTFIDLMDIISFGIFFFVWLWLIFILRNSLWFTVDITVFYLLLMEAEYVDLSIFYVFRELLKNPKCSDGPVSFYFLDTSLHLLVFGIIWFYFYVRYDSYVGLQLLLMLFVFEFEVNWEIDQIVSSQ